jgi:hypothetical protein
MVTTAIPVPQGAVLADNAPAPAPQSKPDASGSVPIPQGAVLADAPTPPVRYGSGPGEQQDFLTKTEDAIDSVSSGSAEEAWNTIKGILSNVAPGMQAATEIPAEIKAFEGARRKGMSVVDAAKESSRVLQQKNNALGAIKDRAKEFVNNPTHASGKLLVDLIPLALGFEGMAGEGEAATVGDSAEEAAPVAAQPETPGIVKQIMRGKGIEQEPAQGALREAAEGQEPSGLDSLAQAPQDSLREVLARPVSRAKEASTAAYEKVAEANKAAEPIVARIKQLNDKLDEFIAQDEPTRAAEDEAGQMEAERDSLNKELEKHVDPQITKTASDSYKRYRALQSVEKNVMKNPATVGGDVKFGTPETVNVENTINTLRRLQNTKYGDQLKLAFGDEGSQQLLNKLYGAQRAGVHAMRLQNVASWIAKAVGLGAAITGLKTVKGAVSGE